MHLLAALHRASLFWFVLKRKLQALGETSLRQIIVAVLLKSIVAGRSGCSVWEKHEVEVDGKLFKGIPGLDMLRFPITEMFHVLFKGFVPKVVKQLLGSLTTLQRDILSIRCLDCCVDRGEERPLYDIHHHPGSMTAHCWVHVCL